MAKLTRKKPGITLSMDKLIDCPCCNSNACYESEFTTQEGKVTTWLCMTCGMTTNTSMTEDSELLKESFEVTAEIIKDNKQIHDGLVWLLTVITMPDKGMIFPEPIKDSSTLEGKPDWQWTVVKSIPVPEEDQEKYPIPNKPGEFYKTKMDMESVKRFGKLEFMDAAEELGMFGNLKK
jgi:transcription elongation factor Elf1